MVFKPHGSSMGPRLALKTRCRLCYQYLSNHHLLPPPTKGFIELPYPPVELRLPPRCHATILSRSVSVKNGANQSRSNSSTAGLLRCCTTPQSHSLKVSGSLALSAEMSSFSSNSAMRVSKVMFQR